MKEILENFVCKVCQNVAIDPKKCSVCSQVQCSTCTFKKDENSQIKATCHSECNSTEFTKLNRIEQNILNAITFDCHVQDCADNFKYEDFHKHMKECHPQDDQIQAKD